MYSEQVRNQALQLVAQGLSPAEASRKMGGHPTGTIIKKWANGQIPTGTRAKRCYVPVEEKVKAVNRLFYGEDYHKVAEELGCAPDSLLTWRRKLEQGGADALRTPRDVREEINRRMRQRLEEQGHV